MTHLSTLPNAAEQTRHALLLLGAPPPARLLVEVHAAFFDGDLAVPAVAALLRDRVPGFCHALDADLSAARGLVALADWPLERRLVTPAARASEELAMILRVAEFAGMRAYAGRGAHLLLRGLADAVPGGNEALDLSGAVREAIAASATQVDAERELRASALAAARLLPADQQLFGVPAVPHQRGAS